LFRNIIGLFVLIERESRSKMRRRPKHIAHTFLFGMIVRFRIGGFLLSFGRELLFPLFI
jgi:hypothetical protein